MVQGPELAGRIPEQVSGKESLLKEEGKQKETQACATASHSPQFPGIATRGGTELVMDGTPGSGGPTAKCWSTTQGLQ